MADKLISQLPASTGALDNDITYLDSGGVDYKLTMDILAKFVTQDSTNYGTNIQTITSATDLSTLTKNQILFLNTTSTSFILGLFNGASRDGLIVLIKCIGTGNNASIELATDGVTDHVLSPGDSLSAVWNDTDSKWETYLVTDQGWYKKGSALNYKQTATPTLKPDGTSALDVNDDSRVWFDSDDDNKIKVYDGGTTAFQDVKVEDAVNATIADRVNDQGGGADLRCKVLDIGTWNMDTNATAVVVHGLTLTKIRGIFAFIRNDAGTTYYMLNIIDATGSLGGGCTATSTNIILTRALGGLFDTAVFSSVAFSRGTILVWYTI